MNQEIHFNPASFRDREGRVFSSNGRIFRSLSSAAAQRLSALEKDGRLLRLIEEGFLIPSRLSKSANFSFDPNEVGETVIEAERIPFLTYPYEWSFDMLKDAALLTLDLLQSCLEKELILKDATPFNVALHKNRMIFIDTLSVDLYREGQPWEGYTQFCRQFLFPLMLTSQKGVDFQPWLKGEPGGLTAASMSRIFGLFDAPFRGGLTYIHLQALLERRLAQRDVSIKKRFNQRLFPKKILLKMIQKLHRTVSHLKPKGTQSSWKDYEVQNIYKGEDENAKAGFLDTAAKELKDSRWIDLGCNNGKYSLIVSAGSNEVIAVDSDPHVVNNFYKRCRGLKKGIFYPVVLDLMNPSPSLGWRLSERPSIFQRAQSDAFLALALIHHLCIGNNVPLDEFVLMLKSLGHGGIVEWVDKKDPMVQRLLRNRTDIFADYTWENFRTCLEKHFEIRNIREILDGTRKLCFLARKSS